MFAALASFTNHYRIPITVFWIVAAAALFFFAPKLSEVGVTDESQFLPQNTQSSVASRLVKERFVRLSEPPAGTATIVIYNAQGLGENDTRAAEAIRDWLASGSAPREVVRVTSVFDNAALRSTLVSSDQTTMIMLVDLSASPLSEPAGTALREIRGHLQENYPQTSIYVTGETGLFQDMFSSIRQTIDRATLITIILVAVLLLIVYRSPIAILLPLLAIGCSFAVASGILGFLGQAGAKFSTLAEAYLVVIIFGVGTDYCLFIVSRFQEELRKGERVEARRYAVEHISPVIAASALTVIVAFLALAISHFGLNKTTGYAMAIGVAIMLLAGLTLVPALMSLFGRYLFWPTKVFAPRKGGRFGWQNIGTWVSRHAAVPAVAIIVVLLLPYLALFNLNRSADITNQLPQRSQSVQGYRILASHFAAGELSPSYVVIESKSGDITRPEALSAIGEIAQKVQGVQGVSHATYYASPVQQLSDLAAQVRAIGDTIGTGGGVNQLATLQTSGQLLQGLAIQYPGITQSPNFQQVTTNLAQISNLAGQLITTPQSSLPALLVQLRAAVYQAADSLNGLVSEFKLQNSTPFTTYLLSTYFSQDKAIARINVVLSGDPRSNDALATIDRIRGALGPAIQSSALAGSADYVGGESAVSADIMDTSDADFGRVVGVSVAGIFVIIAILLRSVLAPLYMVGTVLLNYGATLGIATWLFLSVLNQGSMNYMIPLFVFVVLVALGADYNIFLVSRIREEARHRPMKEAVATAVANTGGVITACGIILAGTFATLMSSPLQVVFQIGAAIAIGVLIDTFIVRALLVPALATLAGRWSWWPSSLFRQLSDRKRTEVKSKGLERV